MVRLIVLLALIVTASAVADNGVVGLPSKGGAPHCPSFYIIKVFKPSLSQSGQGCVCFDMTTHCQPVTVVFSKTKTFPLLAGQTVRYESGVGYYAYPP